MLTCAEYGEESFALGIGFKHLPTTVRVRFYAFPSVLPDGFHKPSESKTMGVEMGDQLAT